MDFKYLHGSRSSYESARHVQRDYYHGSKHIFQDSRYVDQSENRPCSKLDIPKFNGSSESKVFSGGYLTLRLYLNGMTCVICDKFALPK